MNTEKQSRQRWNYLPDALMIAAALIISLLVPVLASIAGIILLMNGVRELRRSADQGIPGSLAWPMITIGFLLGSFGLVVVWFMVW